MVDIANIVDVTITKETQSVSQQGFGTPLILGVNGPGADYEVRSYENIDEVADDYAVSDEEYEMASAVFSQSPRVREVKIATLKTLAPQQRTITLSTDLIAGNVFSATLNGVLCSTTFATTHADQMTAMCALLAAVAGVNTATPVGDVITIVADDPDVPMTLTGVTVTGGLSQPTVTLAISVPNVGYVDNLTEIVKYDNDWYGLLVDTVDPEEVQEIAEWVESHYKIFFTRSESTGIIDPVSTTDIAYLLEAAGRERTAVIFNEDNDDYIDGAWMGKGLPFAPGQITYKFKQLSGPSASTSLTATQRNAALNKNANLYSYIAGVSMMEEGTMASGEFIDIIIGIDWLRARIAENIFAKLVNADKIPYTDAGVAIIESEIRAVLENGIKNGLIARSPDDFGGKDYIVEAPKVADIADTDKANRLLPDVVWQARLAGAIHKVIVRGKVTL